MSRTRQESAVRTLPQQRDTRDELAALPPQSRAEHMAVAHVIKKCT